MLSPVWKITRLVVPLAVMTLLAAYLLAGYVTKSRITQAVNAHNEIANGYQLVLDDYSQGLFSSEFAIGIASETEPMLAMIRPTVAVAHGPWPLKFATASRLFVPRLAIAQVRLPMLRMVHPDLEQTQLTLDIGLGQKLRLSTAIPSFEQMLPVEGETVVVSFFGLNGQADIHPSTHEAKGGFSGGGFSVRMNDNLLLLGDLDYRFDLQDSFSFPVGHATLSLNELTFDNGQDKIGVEQVFSRGDSSLNAGLLQSNGTTQARRVLIGRHQLGPLDLRMVVGGFNRDAIENLQAAIQQPQVQSESLMPLIDGVLQHQPFVHIESMNLRGDEGEATLQGRLRANPVPPGEALNGLLPLLDGYFEFTADRTFLETLWGYGLEFQLRDDNKRFKMNTPEPELRKQAVLYAKIQLSDLVQQGLLEQSEEQYRVQLTIDQGQVKVNNMPVLP